MKALPPPQIALFSVQNKIEFPGAMISYQAILDLDFRLIDHQAITISLICLNLS